MLTSAGASHPTLARGHLAFWQFWLLDAIVTSYDGFGSFGAIPCGSGAARQNDPHVRSSNAAAARFPRAEHVEVGEPSSADLAGEGHVGASPDEP